MGEETFDFVPGDVYGRGWLRDFVGALLQHDLVEFEEVPTTFLPDGTKREKAGVRVHVYNLGDR